ncbi:MAG TPA: hypothetical protein VFA40_08485 [Terriglobales bacterium]|jgi:hypothetical protein|nr:hypothetical protein [Terriglobales bacterium]
MANQLERPALTAEIADLQRQQYKSLGDAISLGWTAEELAAWQNRDTRITFLERQLAEIDALTRGDAA